MKATVIIPTLNAESCLPGLLHGLMSQSIRDHEMLVIDSESRDRTREIAASFHVPVLSTPRKIFNHGGTRNAAALEASGEYLVFLTQDALPMDELLLENLLKPMDEEGSVSVSYGRQIAHDRARVIEKIFRGFNYPGHSCTRDRDCLGDLGIRTFFCSNACAAYRRSAFEKLGGFRKDVIMNEDMEFVYRAVMSGHKVHYAADAMVRHSHNYGFSEQFRRYVDIGVFFADNRDLALLARNEAEGRRYLSAAAGFLLRRHMVPELARLFLDSMARYAGYKVGSCYRVLPVSLLRRISMNRGYWKTGSEQVRRTASGDLPGCM